MDEPRPVCLIAYLRGPPAHEALEALLGALERVARLRIGLALSGALLGDLVASTAPSLARVAAQVEAGRIELVGAPQHGPVLSSIPERDAVAQILAHATRVKQVFGARPRGCWLPLGVWDPALPRVLARAGMKWCPIEDRFLAHLEPSVVARALAVRTEREGCTTVLLPVDSAARAAVARSDPAAAWALLLRRQRTSGSAALAVGLGVGPEPTGAQLAALLESVPAEVRPELPSATTGRVRPGRVYLPSAAPPEVGVPFERHIAAHDAAARLHTAMLRASTAVARLEREVRRGPRGEGGADPADLTQARRYLFRAQDADVYWHGAHAGTYDPALRQRAWRDVIRAERTADRALGRDAACTVDVREHGGGSEVVFRTPVLRAIVDPAARAGVTELCWLERARNLVDVAERGVAERGRPAFADFLLGPDVAHEAYTSGAGTPICAGGWTLVTHERRDAETCAAVLSGEALPESGGRLWVQKSYRVSARGTVEVELELTNRGADAIRSRLGTELALTTGRDATEHCIEISSSDASSVCFGAMDPARHSDVASVAVGGASGIVRLEVDRPARLWQYPVHAHGPAHSSEAPILQGVRFVFLWAMELFPRERKRVGIRLEVAT